MRRALLDENAPKRLARLLRSADLAVEPFPNLWKGLSNGRLLDQMEADGFSVLVTCDQSITAQQRLTTRRIGLVVLMTNDVPILSNHLASIRDSILAVRPGEAVRLDFPAT